MIKYNKNRLIRIIVFLTIINISTIGTIIYHTYFQHFDSEDKLPEQIDVPNNHLGRFFREELNLTDEQHRQFKVLRQKFHGNAVTVSNKMQVVRGEIMTELGKDKSDTAYLHSLAKEIGDLHEELKHLTFEYYLGMKNICNDNQKEKLYQIFRAMSENGAEIKMPNKKTN